MVFPKGAAVMAGIVFLFASCLKSSDNTGNGPKAQMAVTNFVVNSAVNVTIDNASLSPVPIVFGGVVSTAAGGYTPIGAGLHSLQVTAPNSLNASNTISLTNGIHYSLFMYDPLQKNPKKTLLLADALTAVDTVAKARFLQFIPGSDS